ncbi:MAG: geranylgeranylglycerol-phosphate geranylgeranyltransferase [Bacteroidota bacterium]
MSKIWSFFQLIRIKNLLFIAVTQVFFYQLIIQSSYQKILGGNPLLSYNLFHWMVVASLLIAGAGYIINDYFDLNIDKINKPGKLIVDKEISRRWAMMWHFILSIAGLIITAYVAIQLNNFLLFLLNGIAVILLWVYSTTFKKKLLSGNVIISLLTAWVIFMLFVAEINWKSGSWIPASNLALINIYKLAILYGGFAFMVSLVREVIKDMEDELGDRKYGCKTMPISWGIHATKVFVSVWLIVLFGSLSAIMVYALFSAWYLLSLYIFCTLLAMIVSIFLNLKNAVAIEDYTKLTRQVKLLMLMGILSMILYHYYYG